MGFITGVTAYCGLRVTSSDDFFPDLSNQTTIRPLQPIDTLKIGYWTNFQRSSAVCFGYCSACCCYGRFVC